MGQPCEAVFCYHQGVMRHIFILALALSLAGLGPLPLSACALLSSQPAECEAQKTSSPCERMNMDESGTRLVSAPDSSCCVLSETPLPPAQSPSLDLSLTAVAAVVPDPLSAIAPVARTRPAFLVPDLSPPALQSLLCTFLI
jgi:hypothetical protein